MMSRINKLFFGLAVLTVFGLATPAIKAVDCEIAAGNIVTNCGFESGAFAPGWTAVDGTSFTTVNTASEHSGTFGVSSGPVGIIGTVSQTLATTPGATYTLSYWLSNLSGSTPNSFSASFGGAVVPGSSMVNAAAFAYTQFTFSVVATGASTVLQFSFRHDPSFWLLDDVVVAPSGAAIPEPATMLLLGSGLVGLAMKARRRRQSL